MKKYLLWTKKIQIPLFLLFVITNGLMVVNSFLNTKMTNAVIGGDISRFITLALYVVIAMLLVSFFNYFIGKFKSKSREEISKAMREDYLKNFIDTYRPSGEKKKLIAEVISKMTNDINFVMENGIYVFYDFINALLGIILPLIGATIIHPIFIAIFPISVVFQTFVLGKISPKIQALSTEQSEENQFFVKKLSDIFEGFDTLYQGNFIRGFRDKFQKSSQMLEKKRFYYGDKMSFYNSLIMGLMVLSQFLYILFAGYLVAKKKISPGSIVGLITLAQTFYGNTQMGMNSYLSLKSSKSVLDNMIKFPIPENKKELDKIQRGLSVKNLSFSYPNRERGLSNFNHDFKLGEKYLVTGRSGAGKTTLLKLIAGYIGGYSGEIYYDDLELKQISPISLMKEIAYIEQDVYIFNDTLKFNICLGKEVDEKQYRKALDVADLTRFINTKKEKDNFVLEAGGENISGGERQRIAIARAFVSGKRIWIIDEGLQGMDEETIEIVENNLLKENVLLIMISHVSKKREHLYSEVIQI